MKTKYTKHITVKPESIHNVFPKHVYLVCVISMFLPSMCDYYKQYTKCVCMCMCMCVCVYVSLGISTTCTGTFNYIAAGGCSISALQGFITLRWY